MSDRFICPECKELEPEEDRVGTICFWCHDINEMKKTYPTARSCQSGGVVDDDENDKDLPPQRDG